MLKFISLIILNFLSLNFAVTAQSGWSTDYSISGNFNEQRMLEVSVIKDNIIAYSVSKELMPYFSVPQIDILSNGNLLLLHSLEGLIEIYNKHGIKIKERQFYELPPYREQNLKYQIIDNGLVITTSENDKNLIHKLNDDGEKIWEEQLRVGKIIGLNSSADGRIICYSIAKWDQNNLSYKTFVIDDANNPLLSISAGFEFGDISNNNSYFLGVAKRNAFMLNLKNNKLLWQTKLNNEEFFIDGAVKNSEAFLLKGTDPKLTNGNWISETIDVIRKSDSGDEYIIKKFYEKDSDLNFILKSNKIALYEKGSRSIIDIN